MITKYKNKKTGEIIEIEIPNEPNTYGELIIKGVMPLIKPLYENSPEWVKIFPIEDSPEKFAKSFVEKYFGGSEIFGASGAIYKDGMIRGIVEYLESLKKNK